MLPSSNVQQLPYSHMLAVQRPRPSVSLPIHAFDTSTLAAHDFDVDTRTGFMPPDPPVARLPADWALWEDALDHAIASRLRVTDSPDPLDASVLEKANQCHVLLRQVSVRLHGYRLKSNLI